MRNSPGRPWKRHVRAIRLEPGFYSFRHVARPGGEDIVARLRPAVASDDTDAVGAKPAGTAPVSLRLLGAEDRDGAVLLSGHGALAVAHASRPSLLALELRIPPHARAEAFSLSIDRLNDKPLPSMRAGARLHLTGHVQGRGDVGVDDDGWLGAPRGVARIEGFSIRWPGRAGGVDLSYGCTVRGMSQSSRALTGGYVGSRKQARPITAVWFQLVGERASEHGLDVEAVFHRRGRVVGREGERLAGGDDDHLVALRVDVRPQAAAEATTGNTVEIGSGTASAAFPSKTEQGRPERNSV